MKNLPLEERKNPKRQEREALKAKEKDLPKIKAVGFLFTARILTNFVERKGVKMITTEQPKSLKQYCKEAKKRLKQGFWQKYHENLNSEIERAKEAGISESKVRDYYTKRVSGDIRSSKDENEEFYLKVKKLLDEEGEVSNAIGRLTDKEKFDAMSYTEKQRYTLTLSEKYLKAVERYKKERAIGL